MIEGYFGGGTAAICGAHQYDTGQRLMLHGVPSPQELGEADDFLSGDLVSVQVQYGYMGEAQTQMRLAEWNEMRGAWMASIPDSYLARHEAVQVYVYVGHGTNGEESRSRTMYTGVFLPMSRPAPEGTVTDEQTGRWKTLEAEVDIVLAEAEAAKDSTELRIEEAQDAAEQARQAADRAETARQQVCEATEDMMQQEARLGNLRVMTQALPAGSAATAALSGQVMTLGIPRGAKGAKGDAGDDGPNDITLSFQSGVLEITPR